MSAAILAELRTVLGFDGTVYRNVKRMLAERDEALRQVAKEMREHKINHGKSHSPTLIAWAERIEKEIQ